MRGYFTSGVSLGAVFIFCFCLFLSDNLLMVWLFLELATLALVPTFFLSREDCCLDSLFSYLVVSSVSSSFIVCGLLFEGVLGLMVLGFVIKFGLFPFFGWVYKVVLGSNWGVVWGFSVLLKSPFILLCFFLSSGASSVVNFISFLTLALLAFLFWVYSYSWFHCWCHMMLSSSVVLVAMSFSLSVNNLLGLFCIYALWATSVILFLSRLSGMELGGIGSAFYFCVLLLSLPCSVSVFYKLLMGVCVYSCFFPVFVFWVLYSISEQFYLLKFLVDTNIPRRGGASLLLV